MPNSLKFFLGLVLSGLFIPLSVAGQNWHEQASQHLSQGRHDAAYDLLENRNDLAGQTDYDLLLAKAARANGLLTEAVFALERVLAQQPDHAEANFLMAESLYELSEFDLAEFYLKKTLEQTGETSVREQAEKYLENIADGTAGIDNRWHAVFAITLGTDSNVNAATDSDTLFVPSLGLDVILSGNSTETSDEFAGLSGAAYREMAFDGLGRMFFQGGFNALGYFSENDFDQFSYGLTFGKIWKRDSQRLQLGLTAGQFLLDGDRYRDHWGLVGYWDGLTGSATQLGAYASVLRLEYPSQSIRDANRYELGVRLGYRFRGAMEPEAKLAFFRGRESQLESSTPWLGHDFWGLRLALNADLHNDINAFLHLRYEERDYGSINPLYLSSRDDEQSEARMGVKFQLENGWSLEPEYRYTDASSNQAIYEYDRERFMVTLKHRLD